MKSINKTILILWFAALVAMIPALASAERVYYLVGSRHVYRIGHDPYIQVEERKRIEQDYADQVVANQKLYDKAIASGASASVEGPQLDRALQDLANERDQRLGAIYEKVDYERSRHREFQIEGDGPYQVIGINYHVYHDAEVFDNYIVYAPWPGYVVVNRPYGWSYGVVYTPGIFVNLYLGWHTSYISAGRPAFWGFYGHSGPVGVIGFNYAPHGGFVRSYGGRSVIGGGHYSRTVSTSRYTHTSTFSGSRYAAPHHSGLSRPNGFRSSGSANRYSPSHSSGSFRPSDNGTRSSGSFSHSFSGTGSTHASGGRSFSSAGHSSFGGGRMSSGSHGSFGGGHSSFGGHSSSHSGGRRG